MIKTTGMLLDELKNYRSPMSKIGRMASHGDIFPIVRGLYETDGNTPGHLLAASIYGPSYLSFEYALYVYDLIPERVYAYTSATFEKGRRKTYMNRFGTYLFRDVPSEAFPIGIEYKSEGEYAYRIASPEKAICDTLYDRPVVDSRKELIELLFEDMRIDEDLFFALDREKIISLSPKYHSKNLNLLQSLMRKLSK